MWEYVSGIKKKLIAKLTSNIGESQNLPDVSNDPFFIKKKEEAIKFLKKNGLPKGSDVKLEDL